MGIPLTALVSIERPVAVPIQAPSPQPALPVLLHLQPNGSLVNQDAHQLGSTVIVFAGKLCSSVVSEKMTSQRDT